MNFLILKKRNIALLVVKIFLFFLLETMCLSNQFCVGNGKSCKSLNEIGTGKVDRLNVDQ